MRGESSRRGSALLIVLGFLSFMVVSAVAFAIYMRSERAPSSALRSNVASRHLVRAAVSAAMAEIDQAICADPFPGVVNDKSRHDAAGHYYNLWQGRVFMPPQPLGDGDEVDDLKDDNGEIGGHGASRDKKGGRIVYNDSGSDSRRGETVPVLTFEGLGYLPPNLVNDVRFLSRLTWSAKWRYFGFNAGRYAYVAVNVSDYFDVNRCSVTNVRTSSSPVSLASIFEKDADRTKFAADFEAAKQDANCPFVSMLDYNLAMGAKDRKYSPFYNYVGTKGSVFYPSVNGGTHGSDYEGFVFVTDSYRTNAPGESVSLETLDGPNRGQPFDGSLPMDGNAARNGINAQRVILSPQNVKEFKDRLSPLDAMTLYDYLDRDDVPISLALPCCERVPMVVGMKPKLANFQVTATTANPNPTTKQDKFSANQMLTMGEVDALVAFPFKRGKVLNGSYKVQAAMRIFLSTVDYGSSPTGLRQSGFGTALGIAADWKNHGTSSGVDVNDHAITLYSDVKSMNWSSVVDEDDAVKQVKLSFTQPAPNPIDLFTVETVTPAATPAAPSPTPTTTYTVHMAPLDATGNMVVTPNQQLQNLPTGQFYLSCAVWVRIVDNDGNTVDLVPASLDDDNVLNGVDNASGTGRVLLTAQGGAPDYAIFAFSDANVIKYDPNALQNATFNLAMKPEQLYAVDPRFNYAPENWFVANSFNANDWLNETHDFQDKDGERDPDIFMFVSNQGYLQSMAEFAFLPRLSALANKSYYNLGNYNGVVRSYADKNNVADLDYCWKTYHAYPTSGVDDNLFNKGIAEADSGVKVNPYTDSEVVFNAAIRNTPYDWWVAGTNALNQGDNGQNAKDAQTKRKMLADIDESLKYAFNESKGQESKLTDKELESISNAIRSKLRENPSASMLDAWRSLPWDNDNPDNFLGVNVSTPLHSVDRKYLFGFWKNCFASNQQQLFLVFVRAEPMSAGGDAGGKSAQQGGRAVALVWRDPAPTSSGGEVDGNGKMYVNRRPHPMRILFYHKFD